MEKLKVTGFFEKSEIWMDVEITSTITAGRLTQLLLDNFKQDIKIRAGNDRAYKLFDPGGERFLDAEEPVSYSGIMEGAKLILTDSDDSSDFIDYFQEEPPYPKSHFDDIEWVEL